MRTSALRDGDRWIVNGQKVWTTGAHFSDYGLLLARTDPSVSKHAGLTLFVIDMKAPGVEVRPIRQMTGESDFNEVFFADVVVPDDHRLTPPGGGWNGARTTLMFERLNVGGDTGLIDHRAMLEFLRATPIDGRPAIEDAAMRALMARWYVNDRGLKLMTYRTLTALGQGVAPGPEQSIGKLLIASQAQEMANVARDVP